MASEALIEALRHVWRRFDAAALLRANREGLDLDYLTSWSNKLGLTDGLSEAWSEGLPEVPFPLTDRGT